MIRANRLAEYLAEKTGIPRETFIVETSNLTALGVAEPVAGGCKRLLKNYEAQISAGDIAKSRQFTLFALYIAGWFRDFGYSEESWKISTSDYGDEKLCDLIVDLELTETTDLVPIADVDLAAWREKRFDRIVVFDGIDCREVEIDPTGVGL